MGVEENKRAKKTSTLVYITCDYYNISNSMSKYNPLHVSMAKIINCIVAPKRAGLEKYFLTFLFGIGSQKFDWWIVITDTQLHNQDRCNHKLFWHNLKKV